MLPAISIQSSPMGSQEDGNDGSQRKLIDFTKQGRQDMPCGQIDLFHSKKPKISLSHKAMVKKPRPDPSDDDSDNNADSNDKDSTTIEFLFKVSTVQRRRSSTREELLMECCRAAQELSESNSSGGGSRRSQLMRGRSSGSINYRRRSSSSNVISSVIRRPMRRTDSSLSSRDSRSENSEA